MSFMDRFKDKIQAAGEGTKRLGRLGQLKMDKMNAETAVSDAYRTLGKNVADRMIDREAEKVVSDDPIIRDDLDRIRRARIGLVEILDEMESLKK